MEEKKYLKWYNKVGYGSGDIAGNVVYAFLSAFVMVYLTTVIGMDAGIVGSLIALSKLMDGVTDVFFGTMIDKTKTKMGKAKPWMLYGYIGCAITLAAIFAIPVNIGPKAQYAWFFIAYTLLNAVFYTANNIAYSALTALITKNSREQVEMGSYRFIFAFSTSLIIQSVTLAFVEKMGGGAEGWRTVAIIYAVIGLIVNTISALSVKELSEEELKEGSEQKEEEREEKYTLIDGAKLLVANKYYLMISSIYLLQQIYQAMLNVGLFYMMYVLFNEDLYPKFSWAINIPLIIALVITPHLVERWGGVYKPNLIGFTTCIVGRVLVAVAAYFGSIPLMLVFTAVGAFGMGPWQGGMNAVIASCSEYTYLTKNKRVDGTMYSCTSFGLKLGGGLGMAITGWLMDFSGFDGNLQVQPQSCVNMLSFMYLWMPVFILIVITLIMSKLDVEKVNKELKAAK